MIDIQRIREDPEGVKKGILLLGEQAPIDRIYELDVRRREILQELERLRHERNITSKEIGKLKEEAQRGQLIEKMGDVNAKIKSLEADLSEVESTLEELMYQVPNPPHASVPVGEDESENIIVREEGHVRRGEDFGFDLIPHWELGIQLGIIDFERGVKLSGSRFYLLLGMGSRLQRALVNWMVDLHVREHGYTEIYPPAVVKEMCMWGAGQLPKFKDNIYHDVEDDMWFVGTAEIPVTNIYRDEILDITELPKKFVAFTPCFRREKFSAGRDVRGIKRGHQFDKVEMYHFTTPDQSYVELDDLVSNAEDVCRALEIPHRVIEMVTGDLGFTAAKKYDIEMWAPGCGEWLEVSSCSNCESFQARRANIRYRPDPKAKPEFLHTLNGSGLALPRTMIAILENYQQADGSVVIPEVLQPWMGGVERVEREDLV